MANDKTLDECTEEWKELEKHFERKYNKLGKALEGTRLLNLVIKFLGKNTINQSE